MTLVRWLSTVAILGAACSSSGGTSSSGGSGSPTAGTSSGTASGTSSANGATGSSTGSGSGSTASASSGTGSSGSTASSGVSSSGTNGGIITFSIDVSKGPRRQVAPPAGPTPVSPLIYGVDQSGAWTKASHWGAVRFGGNKFTTWNWVTNYFNDGDQFCFSQGPLGDNSLLGALIDNPNQSIEYWLDAGVPSLVTVPIVDYVAGATSNDTTATCTGTPSCPSGGIPDFKDQNVGDGTTAFVFATAADAGPNFVANGPTSAAGPTGSPSGVGPVYQDEFVYALQQRFGSAVIAGGAPLAFALDSDPNRWHRHHPEVTGYDAGALGCGTFGKVGYDEIVNRDIAYAKAVKAAWPTAKVYGPEVVQDGIVYAGDPADPNAVKSFAQYYLEKMAAASDVAGKPLLDVFDVHYFTNADNGDGGVGTYGCDQGPRLFWDPNFTDLTASQTDAFDFGPPNPAYDNATWYPRQMAPRLQRLINAAYAGHTQAAPGLGFSAYNPGCDQQIEGAIAEADLLGIFGREGVAAASLAPNTDYFQVAPGTPAQLLSYQVGAFDSYRNYDGMGGAVGDLAVSASTSDPTDTSVYAFTHSGDTSGRVDLVGINRRMDDISVSVSVSGTTSLSGGAIYILQSGSPIAVMVQAGQGFTFLCSQAQNNCTASLFIPKQSVVTATLQ